jgi:hypothetical protein
MSASVAVSKELPDQVERRVELHRRFLLAGFADPTVFTEIPWDVQLFLLPDDDRDFTAQEIAAAARAAHHGADVYLRHVRVADLPE